MHRAGVKQQAANVQFRLPADGINNTPMKDELSVLVLASDERMNDTTTIIFALEAHTSMPAQSATDGDGTDATPPSIAKFITA